MNALNVLLAFLRGCCIYRAALVAENLALRQQLAVFKRNAKRPRLKRRDRLFWVLISRFWSGWQSTLVIVQPATVVRWHRLGFRLYWRFQSRPGRPKVDVGIRQLIRRMSKENLLWGAPRIRDELALLGYKLAESTVAKYMVRPRKLKPSSPTWKTFLKNHAKEIVACDFFVVPTATFQVLYVFVLLSHDRRRVIHFNVTKHPTARWTGQQIVDAFPYDSAPRYLLRDNDSIYGRVFQDRIASLGIEEVRTAYHSPWQNAYVERLIGSVRRECVDHLIVLDERHLKRILREYFQYYNTYRTHQSLDGNAPLPREPEPPDLGKVIAIPQVGGLHHRYTCVAA